MPKVMCLQIRSGTVLQSASIISKSNNQILIMHLTDSEKYI